MSSKLLSLKWNNHNSAFLHRLKTIKSQELYSDATLACDGRFYPVHKLVLSTCSDYFEQMFERTACKHPVVVLKDVRCEDVEALLNYMYVGEVDVVQGDLARIIKAAECLRIKGLAVPDEPSSPHSHNKEGKRSLRSSSPAEDTGTHNKRARREDSRRTPDGESEGGGGGGRDRLGDDQSSEKEEIVPDDDDDAYGNKDHHPGDQDSAFDPIILVKEEPSEGKQEIYSEETLLQVGLDNHIFKSTPPFPRPYPQRDSIQTWEPPLENPPPDGNVAYVTAADFAPHQLSASVDMFGAKPAVRGKPTKYSGAFKYKTKFSDEWSKIWPFVSAVPGDPHSFRCNVCAKTRSCAHQGVADIRNHIKTQSHEKAVRAMAAQQQFAFQPN